MSFSAEHRRPDHNSSRNDCPSFHDLTKPADDLKGVTKGHRPRPDEDPLVEHILDFLDKYPARLASGMPVMGCIGAC